MNGCSKPTPADKRLDVSRHVGNIATSSENTFAARAVCLRSVEVVVLQSHRCVNVGVLELPTAVAPDTHSNTHQQTQDTQLGTNGKRRFCHTSDSVRGRFKLATKLAAGGVGATPARRLSCHLTDTLIAHRSGTSYIQTPVRGSVDIRLPNAA